MTTREFLVGLDPSEAVLAARNAAEDVDRTGRFPHEAIDAMRASRLLSASLPVDLGGSGAPIRQLAEIARALGSACASTGMIFAMHHSQLLALRNHATSEALRSVARTIADSEALVASATTENTTGGDIRTSTCAVERCGERITLEKNAPVISYGAFADFIFTTARRNADAPPSDQVFVVCPAAETTLEQTSTWDTVGFRGTCSPGFILRSETAAENVFDDDYSTISAHTVQPSAHLLWAAVWLGMADSALAKARQEVRSAARKSSGSTPPQAVRFADLVLMHQQFEATLSQGLQRYEAYLSTGAAEPTIGFAVAMNNIKIQSSTAVVEIVTEALAICGINGYRNNHSASMGQLLRDSYAPSLMVSNDRIRANNSRLVLAIRGVQHQ